MNDYRLYESTFKVRGHDVDIHQRCSPTGYMRMMHEAAQEHILKYKVSAKELIKKNLGWIVLNQYFDIIGEAHFGDKLKLVTYPSGIERIFTYRDYVVINERDEIIAKSCGRFIMMDLEKREKANIPQYIKELIGDAKSIYNIERPHRQRLSGENLINEASFRVRYSDLDLNNHVGNQVYYEWVLDSFDYEFLKHHTLKHIHLTFKEEIRHSAKITSRVFSNNDSSYEHQLISADKCICQGVSKWKKHSEQ